MQELNRGLRQQWPITGRNVKRLIAGCLEVSKQRSLKSLFHIRQKQYPPRFTKIQLGQLNKLNIVLLERQQVLWEEAKKQQSVLTQQLDNERSWYSDYELSIEIKYYVPNSVIPLYTHQQIIKTNEFRQLAHVYNDHVFDWRTKGLPFLDNPYCFLLAELFEQWHIRRRIPDIAAIWNCIHVQFHHGLITKSGRWHNVSKYDI